MVGGVRARTRIGPAPYRNINQTRFTLLSRDVTEKIEVDRDTMAMLKSLNMGNLPGVQLQQSGGSGYRGRKNN